MKELVLYRGIPIVGRMPLFQADMRQAIRDNLKTQTRRVMSKQPSCNIEGAYFDAYNGGPQWNWWLPDGRMCNDRDILRCPYGKVDDVRCMCEPLIKSSNGLAYYRDVKGSERPTGPEHPVISLITGKPLVWRWKRDYLNAIHMPTEAARTVRRTTDLRVERLQEISEEDAIAEGVAYYMAAGGKQAEEMSMYAQFGMLWDSINAKRGYSWSMPQVVWVNAFEKLEV